LTNRFENILVEAISGAITEVLGANGFKTLCFYVDLSIARNNIQQYSNALRKVFGEGADELERKCVEKLYSLLNLKVQELQGYTFVQYVNNAEKQASLK
jgi:hypothetical protein